MAIEHEPSWTIKQSPVLPSITEDGSKGILYKLQDGALHSPVFGPFRNEEDLQRQLPNRLQGVATWHLGRYRPLTIEQIIQMTPGEKEAEIERQKLNEFLARSYSSAIETPSYSNLLSLFERRPYPTPDN